MVEDVEHPHLEVKLFGAPEVLRSGIAIRLSPQQLALVSIVYADRNHGVSRPRVIRVLWQSGGGPAARHRLRQLLLTIRSRTGTALIVRTEDLLMPAPFVTCDLFQFDECFAEGAVVEAARLIQHGFAKLPANPGLAGYNEWRSTYEAALTGRLRSEAGLRFELASKSGRLRAARDAAEAIYLLDPEDPQSVRRVVEARGRAGDIDGAEGAFRVYIRRLPYGATPDAEARDALLRVREMSRPGPLGPAGAARDVVPLVGRAKALLAGQGIFDVVRRGMFGFALITGEAGIGKTRLLQELRREATIRGFRCLEARAVEMESRLPLTPLLDALGDTNLGPHLSAMGRPWDAVIAAVLPPGLALKDAPDELPPVPESAISRRLLDAFGLLLRQLAQESPTLFFIDDLHWADPTTIAVLQFVHRRWLHGSLGFIATARDDQAGPGTPLGTYLTPQSDLTVRRIVLRDLTVSEARTLVEHIGKGRIPEGAKQHICELAGLHPLFLTELARDYIAGRLRLPRAPADGVTIPVSLKQMLDDRLEHLGSRAMKVAGMTAVAGRSLLLTDVATLTELTLHEMAEAVDELLRARLVAVDGGRLHVSHELFRSAIYRHIGQPRQAVNHRILAEHILAGGAEGADGELATHYARAGETALAARHAWTAARRAKDTGAIGEAAHFFQLVVDNEASKLRRAEATAELAHVLYLERDIGRASPLLGLATTRLRSVGRVSDALRAELMRVEGLVELGEAPIRDLWPLLDAVKREARQAPDWEVLALALDTELHLLHRAGDVQGIRALFREMREVSRKGPPEASLLAHAGLALGVLYDDPEEALQSAVRSVTLARDSRTHLLTAMLRLQLVLHYRGMLSLPSFADIIEDTRGLAASSGDVLMRFSIENNLAVAELDAGNLEQAEAIMTLCEEMSGAAEMDLNRAIQANNRAELALARQEYGQAAMAFSEMSTYLSIMTPAYLRDLVHAGMGLCALETGGLSEARRREKEIRDPPTSWYFDPTTILAFRARLFERRGQSDKAVSLLDANAVELESRLTLAWLKVRSIQVRLMLRRRFDVVRAERLAEEARQVARELRLTRRAHEFDRLVARARSVSSGMKGASPTDVGMQPSA